MTCNKRSSASCHVRGRRSNNAIFRSNCSLPIAFIDQYISKNSNTVNEISTPLHQSKVMVSPLSARLLGLQSVDGSLAAQLKELIPLPPKAASSQSSSSSISDEGNCNIDGSISVVDKHGGSLAPDQKPTFTFVSPAALVQLQPATAASHPQPSVSGRIATHTKKAIADTNASTSAPPAGKLAPPTSPSINETSRIRRHIMKSYRPIKPRQPHRPRIRPSGYTADQESNASSSIHSGASLFVLGDAVMPAFTKDTSSVNPSKDRRASQIVEHSRKRKVEELNYSALTVKEDLEIAGKSYECATQLRSRALPAGSVDMSKVRLMTSGTYDEMQQRKIQLPAVVSRRSTSITNLRGEGDDTHRETIYAARSSKNVYDALIADTRQHYNICPKKQRRSFTNNGPSGSSSDKPSALTFDGENSASQLASRLASVAASGHQRPQPERTIDMRSSQSTATPSTSSDTESDASLGALEIAPRLEEGLISDVTDDYAALSPPPPTVDKSANIITTAIENALSYSQKARLVVSSKDTFCVVHANAAYFRLAGLKSSTIVGQSLCNVLNEPTEGLDLRSLLIPTANPSDLQKIVISKVDSAIDAYQDEKEREKESSETMKASSLAPNSKALDCRMSISPVSDSSSSRGLAGLVSGRVQITHYLLELTEFDENAALGDSSKNSTGDATDEGFSVIG